MNLFNRITAGKPKRLIKPVLFAALANVLQMLPFALGAYAVNIIYTAYSLGVTPEMQTLVYIGGGMIFSILLVYVGETLAYRSSFRGAYAFATEGRSEVAEHLRKLPLGTLSSRDPGRLSSLIMNDFTQLESSLTHHLPPLIGGGIASLVALISFSFIDWRMALAMFAAFPLVFLILRAVSKLERKWGGELDESKIEARNRLQEYIGGMKVIKAYNLRGKNFERLEESFKKLMNSSIRIEGGLGPFFLVSIACIKSGLAILTITGVYLILGGTLSVPVFAVFLLVGSRVFDPLAGALMSLPEFKYDALAGERIADMLNEPVMSGTEAPKKGYDLTFDGVSFGYQESLVLNNLSFTVPENTFTAIVGPSGGGKSTVLRLIARFYDPNQGHVHIGGIDMQDIEPEALLKKISMVFQDVYLFQDTIGANIGYGRAEATQEEIEHAAREASCHDFISALPLGYDTPVGEGGNTLSGGEKQRISIARALLKDAPIVLLDEATASLDPESEVEIQKALSRLVRNRTVVMIAHRLKTVVDADQIIVLDKGCEAEKGTHTELLAAGGLYSRLWAIQQRSGAWVLDTE